MSGMDAERAIESEEATSDVIEEMIIADAQEAGADAGRPTSEQKVENSAALQQEVQEQIVELAEQETKYTPPADTAAKEPEKPKELDDNDLYSMKNFSL